MIDSLRLRNWKPRFLALNYEQRFILILIGTLLLIVLATFTKYGFSVDELKGVMRARSVLDFFGSGGQVGAKSAIDMTHGSGPDVIALMLQKLLPFLSYHSRHLVSAIFGVAGIYYAYRFASRFIGEWAGVFAAVFLAVTPMWFGYMFFNHKDIPFATLLLACLYYALVVLTEQQVSRGMWVRAAVAMALLAGTKLVGLVSLLLILAIYAVCLALLPSARDIRFVPDLGRRGAKLAVVTLLGCLLGLMVFWPQFVFFLDVVFREPGKAVVSNSQNPLYEVTYFSVSMPVFLLILAAAGTVCGLYRREATIIAALAAVALFFVLQVVSGVRVYNGSRHLLFIYPYFMFVAAYPVALLLSETKAFLARVAIVGAVALCVADVALEMYRLFPYEYSFYNSAVGGFIGADGVYEIDTWRVAHREALELLATKVPLGARLRIRSCGSKLDYVMRHRDFRLVGRADEADYAIALRRGKKCGFDRFEGLTVLGEVRREGVLLARVYAFPPQDK